MNKFIYNIKHIMQSKTILALLAVVGMIGTFTNVVAGGSTSKQPPAVQTMEVKLYDDVEDYYQGTVEIPVGITNLKAANLIVNSDVNKDDLDRYYADMYVPEIQGVYPIIKATTTNGKTTYECSFEGKDKTLGNQKFNPSPSIFYPVTARLLRGVGESPATSTIDQQDLKTKKSVLSDILSVLSSQLKETIKACGANSECISQIDIKCQTFVDTIDEKLKQIQIKELDQGAMAIDSQGEIQVIKEIFSKLYIILDIPNLLGEDVSLPGNPDKCDPNLHYPEYPQYNNFLRKYKYDLPDYMKQLDKDIQQARYQQVRDQRRTWTYANYQDLVLHQCCVLYKYNVQNGLLKNLTPKTKNQCPNLSTDHLFYTATFFGDFGELSGETRVHFVNMRNTLHANDGLYGKVLQALENMKGKGIIPDPSINIMIEKLKALVA